MRVSPSALSLGVFVPNILNDFRYNIRSLLNIYAHNIYVYSRLNCKSDSLDEAKLATSLLNDLQFVARYEMLILTSRKRNRFLVIILKYMFAFHQCG